MALPTTHLPDFREHYSSEQIGHSLVDRLSVIEIDGRGCLGREPTDGAERQNGEQFVSHFPSHSG